MNQNLKQFVAAHGGRFSKAGRDLLELLCRLEADGWEGSKLPAGQATMKLWHDAEHRPTLLAWLDEAVLDLDLKHDEGGHDRDCGCSDCVTERRIGESDALADYRDGAVAELNAA